MKEKEEINSSLRKEVSELQEQLKTVHEKFNYLQKKQAFIVGKTIHNLKNPVGISSSFAEMILEDLALYTPEKLRKHLTVIKNSCDFSIGLLNNLQYISKLESGKSPLYLEEKNYCKLVKKTVKLQQILADKRSVKLKLTINCAPCKIPLDVIEIKQALNNVIHNAHRYSPENSTVKIKISATEDFIITSIKDTGIGIEKKELKDIFNEFKVISTFSDDGEKCLGLGLTIAREIIEQHKGKISVTSTLEKGSTFTIKIPRN
ncbi:MAG: hypothetical protein COB81_01760 [Flavobacteriaceae bacterium]|nr:MAG: hypothetical protein COB81_01760 [Flavobacteriaceae bacterium]